MNYFNNALLKPTKKDGVGESIKKLYYHMFTVEGKLMYISKPGAHDGLGFWCPLLLPICVRQEQQEAEEVRV